MSYSRFSLGYWISRDRKIKSSDLIHRQMIHENQRWIQSCEIGTKIETSSKFFWIFRDWWCQNEQEVIKLLTFMNRFFFHKSKLNLLNITVSNMKRDKIQLFHQFYLLHQQQTIKWNKQKESQHVTDLILRIKISRWFYEYSFFWNKFCYNIFHQIYVGELYQIAILWFFILFLLIHYLVKISMAR